MPIQETILENVLVKNAVELAFRKYRNTSSYELLEYLIDNKEDVFDFEENYLPKHINFDFAVVEFRIKKLEALNISFEEFQSDYNKYGVYYAFSKLFQMPISSNSILDKALQSGKITLKMIYDAHNENPKYRLNRVISNFGIKFSKDKYRRYN